jgi:Flp pilus assembly protein TadG
MPKDYFRLHKGSKMKTLRDENGQMFVVVVLSMGMLLAFMALAFDVGQFLSVKRQLQTAADAAALAGALEVQQCGTTANCNVMTTAATSAITEDGIGTPSLLKNCATNTNTALTLVLNNGPCALGTNDPNHGNTQYVEAEVTLQQPAFLARIVGFTGLRIAARSEAAAGNPPSCVYVTNPTASQALLMNGGSSLVASCGVTVASTSSSALLVDGGSSEPVLTGTAINIAGGDLINDPGQAQISPSPTLNYTGSTADPLSNYAAPTNPGCSQQSGNYTPNGPTVTFNPGGYCGGINLNSGVAATFNSGVYYMGGSINVDSGASITGTGVTFYFNSGTLQMNSSSTVSISAPNSGTYAGMLLYAPSSNTAGMDIDTGSTSTFQGIIYLPGATLTLNSGSNAAAYTILDVNTLIVDSGDKFTIGSNYSSLSNSPISGSGAVLVE